MIYFDPRKWTGSYRWPPFYDPRWAIAFLLGTYTVLGCVFLGFSRSPLQISLGLVFGMALDAVLSGLIRGEKSFPLSAVITCLSLAILLNYSLGYYFLWTPIFMAIASKYLLTLNGKHIFNPSLFGICFSLWICNEFVSLAPTYQWYGSVQTAFTMLIFVVTGAVLLFLFRIERHWLVISFLIFYTLQTALRSYILRYHIPAGTLFVGTLTSPAFYLFTFYMITDPKTSPPTKRGQILTGMSIALFDLYYHTKFSIFTFFYAGMTVALTRALMGYFQNIKNQGILYLRHGFKPWMTRLVLIGILAVPMAVLFHLGMPRTHLVPIKNFRLESIPSEYSGIGARNGHIIEQSDPRVRHVAKWLLSVGDAVASADVDLDGKMDLFFTQPLKSLEWRGKLFLNKGKFKFEKVSLPALEKYLGDFKQYGIPTFALFFDYDNDGDKDLFVGFAYGKSHFFENSIIPDGKLSFREVPVPFFMENNTMCVAGNAFDFNKDGFLDLFVANVLPPYLKDYKGKVPFSLFNLPPPEYPKDRRMLHFMHESWHNSNNGGKNYLLLNEHGKVFSVLDSDKIGLKETRWSLSVAEGDLNGDGWPDIYIANDFGHDDCYLNIRGQRFERKEGGFFNDLGRDTYKGMNASIADIDGNLQEDVYVSNVYHHAQAEGSLLWMNESKNKELILKDKAAQYGALNPNRFGWGAAMVDINLDGRTDILQANGMVSDIWDKLYDKPTDYWYYFEKVARATPDIFGYADQWPDIRGAYIFPDEADRVYLNYQGKQFEDVADKVGFNHRANTRGIAAVDLDNDGDFDVVLTDQFGEPKLYENKISGQNWIGFDLIGDGQRTNKDAIGTKVWLYYKSQGEEKVQFQEVHLSNGLSAQGDRRLIFGLGENHNRVEYVHCKIEWFNGPTQWVKNLEMNRYHLIKE